MDGGIRVGGRGENKSSRKRGGEILEEQVGSNLWNSECGGEQKIVGSEERVREKERH